MTDEQKVEPVSAEQVERIKAAILDADLSEDWLRSSVSTLLAALQQRDERIRELEVALSFPRSDEGERVVARDKLVELLHRAEKAAAALTESQELARDNADELVQCELRAVESQEREKALIRELETIGSVRDARRSAEYHRLQASSPKASGETP